MPSLGHLLRWVTDAMQSHEDDLVHAVCDCDPDTARCGTDVTDQPWTEDLATSCVVCVDLEWRPCERCGQ